MFKEEMDTFYTYLQSQQTAQQFLLYNYKQLNDEHAEIKSYENANTFMYYLQHGRTFFLQGGKIDISVQPILYFYGISHLIKALLLTRRPNYPESSSILAHGVSTRKRKKKQYSFLRDEVKPQLKGLFPYFAEHLYKFKNAPNSKINMETLFSTIPEMNSMFVYKQTKNKMVPVGRIEDQCLQFPMHIFDHFHVTEETLLRRIKPYLPNIEYTFTQQDKWIVQLSSPFLSVDGPFKIYLEKNYIYFPNSRDVYTVFSEIMVHYLILYNLSMISRYETEWWGDLFATKSDVDYPFIVHYLKIAKNKIPRLIEKELLDMSKHPFQ